MSKITIILDTNFLMIPELHGVDIFSELDRIIDADYDLIIPEVVIGELENIEKNGELSERKAARVGLELSSRAERIESEEPADKEILRLAQDRENSAVATNDSRLQKLLRDRGVPIIFLRQKSHLETDIRV